MSEVMELKALVAKLMELNIPKLAAEGAVAGAIGFRHSANLMKSTKDQDQKTSILLDYVDEVLRDALCKSFILSEHGEIANGIVTEVVLSGLMTHAAHGCIMTTTTLQEAKTLFNTLANIAFDEIAGQSVERKKEAQKLMEDKKNARLH